MYVPCALTVYAFVACVKTQFNWMFFLSLTFIMNILYVAKIISEYEKHIISVIFFVSGIHFAWLIQWGMNSNRVSFFSMYREPCCSDVPCKHIRSSSSVTSNCMGGSGILREVGSADHAEVGRGCQHTIVTNITRTSWNLDYFGTSPTTRSATELHTGLLSIKKSLTRKNTSILLEDMTCIHGTK